LFRHSYSVAHRFPPVNHQSPDLRLFARILPVGVKVVTDHSDINAEFGQAQTIALPMYLAAPVITTPSTLSQPIERYPS
jgi:hypothetical protein